MAKWQGMETAPRDRDFLVELQNGYITRGRYLNQKYFACDCTGPSGPTSDPTPIAWQEIPAGIKRKKAGARPSNDYTPEFLAFYKGFPTRRGESKFEALKAWRRLGPEMQAQAIAAKPVYVSMCSRKDPDYFPACSVWLNQRRFETIIQNEVGPAGNGDLADTGVLASSPDDWRRRLRLYQRTSSWNPAYGPPPGSPGCRVPAELLQSNNI